MRPVRVAAQVRPALRRRTSHTGVPLCRARDVRQQAGSRRSPSAGARAPTCAFQLRIVLPSYGYRARDALGSRRALPGRIRQTICDPLLEDRQLLVDYPLDNRNYGATFRMRSDNVRAKLIDAD